MEENRGFRYLLTGLQEAAEASRCEVRAWEATFEDVLPLEEWHRGNACQHLARHAIQTVRANELRCRLWQILSRLREPIGSIETPMISFTFVRTSVHSQQFTER